MPASEAVGLSRGGLRRSPERWIVKSIWEDASLGLGDDAVFEGDDAATAPRLDSPAAGDPGAPWFAEAYVEGREFNLALLAGREGVEVLPPAEMLFEDYPDDKPRIVGYAAKWRTDSFEYSHTVRTFDLPPTDAPLVAQLTRLARDCWTLFGLRGWARVDLRVDADGRPGSWRSTSTPASRPTPASPRPWRGPGSRSSGPSIASSPPVARGPWSARWT